MQQETRRPLAILVLSQMSPGDAQKKCHRSRNSGTTMYPNAAAKGVEEARLFQAASLVPNTYVNPLLSFQRTRATLNDIACRTGSVRRAREGKGLRAKSAPRRRDFAVLSVASFRSLPGRIIPMPDREGGQHDRISREE